MNLLDGSLLAEQIEIERMAIEEGIDRYRNVVRMASSRHESASLKPVERLVVTWVPALEKAIEAERELCRAEAASTDRRLMARAIYGHCLEWDDPEVLAVITLREILSSLVESADGTLINRLAYAIGRAVFAHANWQLLNEQSAGSWKELYRRGSQKPTLINRLAKKRLDDPHFDIKVTARLGGCLLHAAESYCAVPGQRREHGEEYAPEPAFVRVLEQYTKTRVRAWLTLDPRIHDIIDEGHRVRALLRPVYPIMVVPPYRWCEASEGGYINIRTPIIANPTRLQKRAIAEADMRREYEILDILSGQEWEINPGILARVTESFEGGGGELGLPKFDVAPLPLADPLDPEGSKKRRAEARAENRAEASRRRILYTKLDVARRWAGRGIFFTHRYDFRGRAYPDHPYLNHQGDDVSRALLRFREPEELTLEGERWLCVHIANCHGDDKLPFDERVEMGLQRARFAEDNVHDADEPWQFLAACEALQKGTAQVPVGMDGTSNALQHYAAWTLCPDIAAAVNMVPGDKPSDVYSTVLQLVKIRVESDARDNRWEAIEGLRYLSRKLVKQPFMTTFYGITRIGAARQIFGTLKDAGVGTERVQINGKLRSRAFRVALYLAEAIEDSVAALFPRAISCMKWFQDCAGAFADIGEPYQLVTPTGLPLIQPYRNFGPIRIDTAFGKLTMHDRSADDLAAVDKGGQKSPAAANTIHAYDKAHMGLTAIAARALQIPFAASHDAWLTSPNRYDELARATREQFIALYSVNPFEALIAQWTAKFPDLKIPDPPARGNFDLSEVLRSPYFFN